MDSSLRVVSAPSLRERVAERIRAAIASGRFKPGERLIERELCEAMAVSRTSLREAFRELESEGLLTTLPNRGPIVSPIGVELAESIYQVRAELEGLAARLFARRASDQQIAELERAVDALDRVYEAYEPGRLMAAKTDFYRLLIAGAGNPVAAQMLRTIHTRVAQLWATSLSSPDRARASSAEIHRLLAALKARDEDAAWRACVDHVGNAAKAAIAVLRSRRTADGGAPDPSAPTR